MRCTRWPHREVEACANCWGHRSREEAPSQREQDFGLCPSLWVTADQSRQQDTEGMGLGDLPGPLPPYLGSVVGVMSPFLALPSRFSGAGGPS